jgi:WXXGXW repeat (2 copies)
MLRKSLLSAVFGLFIAFSAANAEVVVKIGPPRPVVEARIAAPGPGYVWTAGYHRWDGHAYVWVPGAWVRPPHPGAHWEAHRWEHRHDGWYFHEGHWR